MKTATVSPSVVGHGLPAAQRSELVDTPDLVDTPIGAKDLRHESIGTFEASDSKSFRHACSASLLKQASALKDSLRKRAWQLKLQAGGGKAWRQEEATREAAARKEAWRREWAAREVADQEGCKAGATGVRARAWGAATRKAVKAAACAARAAEAAEAAKVACNALEWELASGCEGGPSEAALRRIRRARQRRKVLDGVYPITAKTMTDPVRTSDRIAKMLRPWGAYACPITGEIMAYPGYERTATYERTAITEGPRTNDAYVCPITAEIMTDPVCTSDGFTYERTAITEWLRTNDSSPSTGVKLKTKEVIPNITVRCLLRDL